LENEDFLLENERISIPLDMENALFTRSAGGLISLQIKDGEFFERVVPFRCFPVTNPDEFISIREPDTKKMGRGKEIGMIRRLDQFDAGTVELINSELDKRYFMPRILKIHGVKEQFGYSYWDTDTSAGKITFIMTNPFSNIRILEDGRVFINDIDGNNFQIDNPKALDPQSYKKIEMYL